MIYIHAHGGRNMVSSSLLLAPSFRIWISFNGMLRERDPNEKKKKKKEKKKNC